MAVKVIARQKNKKFEVGDIITVNHTRYNVVYIENILELIKTGEHYLAKGSDLFIISLDPNRDTDG